MKACRRGRGNAAVVALLVVSAAVPLPSSAVAEVVRSDAEVAAMNPIAQASLLEPLRQLARAVDALGRSSGWRGSYSGVELDAARDEVEVFTTDVRSGRTLLKAARTATPRAQWSKAVWKQARYSRADLDAAAERIMTGPHHALVSSVSVAADGSGIDLQAVHGRAGGVVPATVSVAVRVRRETARRALSWADVKWHDTSPFIGGDALTSTGQNLCTAGLPAVRRSDGAPVMITAAHCFTAGTRIFTRAGKAGDFTSHQVGNYVGTVGQLSTVWDAEMVTGTANVADESDTTFYKPLTSVGYSYPGDYVCHDGVRSFFLGHPTPCGIKVIDGDIWFAIGGHMSRGVEGRDVTHHWGARAGDSGATIFAVEPGGQRQARGKLSAGGADFDDQTLVDWTEAPDIFAAFNLKLNPKHYG